MAERQVLAFLIHNSFSTGEIYVQIMTCFGAEQAGEVTESAVKLRAGEIAKMNPDDAARAFAPRILRWFSSPEVKQLSRLSHASAEHSQKTSSDFSRLYSRHLPERACHATTSQGDSRTPFRR